MTEPLTEVACRLACVHSGVHSDRPTFPGSSLTTLSWECAQAPTCPPQLMVANGITYCPGKAANAGGVAVRLLKCWPYSSSSYVAVLCLCSPSGMTSAATFRQRQRQPC